MPQLTYPFFYLSDFLFAARAIASGTALASVYWLPRVLSARLARTAVSGAFIPFVASPLEQFKSYPFLELHVSGSVYALTVTGFYALLGIGLLSALFSLVRTTSLVPTGAWAVLVEAFYSSVLRISASNVGHRDAWAFPLLAALFGVILVTNLVGLVPYNFTVTSGITVCLGLSLVVWLFVSALGLSRSGVHFFDHFVPQGTPIALAPLLALIETVSYAARALSLGVRLFSNMLAGHTLLAILSGFLWKIAASGVFASVVSLLPFGIFVALVGLELAVGFIQAYVFVVLTASYLRDAA